MRFPMILVVGALVLGGCSSGRVSVAGGDPDAGRPESAPARTAKATHSVQGPVAVLGIPPAQFPPSGSCRVWMPGTPAAQQPDPCSCFSLLRNVPAGAWVLYRPSADDTVVQVTTYDPAQPNKIASLDYYDVKTGKHVRSGNL